jgi:hypothetical protein
MQREYKDFTAKQYQTFKCTSYTGGASWLRSTADEGFFVVACTPVEISEYFRKNPESTVRGQFVPFTGE